MSPQRLGQNFLTDRSVAGEIIRRAGVTPATTVLEVGPGKGALTNQLAASATTLTVIEFDSSLAEVLRGKFEGIATVDVVEGDARTIDPASLRLLNGRKYTLVANLPYYAATPIIRNFLESEHLPEKMVVMVQREVADEMQAAPGQMGMLSLAIQVYAEVEVLFDVPPAAFSPRPKVTSSVIVLTPRANPLVAPEDQIDFFRLAKAGFKAPRKQLHNSLATGLNVDLQLARSIIEAASVDTARRPATISIPEWKQLLDSWRIAGCPFVVHGTSREEREKSLKR